MPNKEFSTYNAELEYLKDEVDTVVFIRKLWSLSLVLRDDIISTYLKILKDMPQWEDDEEDHGAGEMRNNGMRNYVAYFERTWVSFNNFSFVNLFFNAFIILDWSSC